MADGPGGNSSTRWVVLAVLVLLFAFLAYRFLIPGGEEAPAGPAGPVANPTEWATDEPGGVDVDLPDTPMTNVPHESETGDAAEAGK